MRDPPLRPQGQTHAGRSCRHDGPRRAGHSPPRDHQAVLAIDCLSRPPLLQHPPLPLFFSLVPLGLHPLSALRAGGSPCRLSSGSWALRAISNFPPHFRFFITGQAWPQARLLNGAACTDPRARVFNTALSAFPDSPVCLQCGPAGRTPAPPHAALPGLATPRSPALASIFCVPTSLRVPLHTRLRPAGQLAGVRNQLAYAQPRRSTSQPPTHRSWLPSYHSGRSA